jgi:tetratricopeptide (TPR) repeat protein
VAAPLPVLGTPEDARAQAAARAQEGDLEGACRLLGAALEAAPADAALCEDLFARREAWFAARFAEATTQMEAGDLAGAVGTLEAMQQIEPLRAAAVALLEKARSEYSRQRLAAAEQAEAAGDFAAADAALRDAIASAPFLVEARRTLGTLRARQAELLDAEAEDLLARGEMEAGVAALEKAQALAPSPARADRLERAGIDREFAAGLDGYHQKRYQEALFQFKKVLARDPDHVEAKRYLGFAQKFVKDAAEDTLGERFRYLE